VDRDPASLWLSTYRGLSVDGIAALDLVRVLPKTYRWPRWVPTLGMDRDAWLQVYRLAVPTFTASGELAALRFRAVDRVGPRWTAPAGCRIEDRNGRAALVTTVRGKDRELPKALASVGVGHGAGLVMADPMGLALLRGTREDDGVRWDGRVVIVEGEPDLWAVAASGGNRIQRHGDGFQTFAAFAVEAGSWTAEIAARIPDGARVLVWTDLDDAGDRYAAAVNASLTHRCDVLRATRPESWNPHV
jgi:5S rRNA maturation endonuclease (ribonuclease M5)